MSALPPAAALDDIIDIEGPDRSWLQTQFQFRIDPSALFGATLLRRVDINTYVDKDPEEMKYLDKRGR